MKLDRAATKPISPVTAVLFPFVSYLLTLPRIKMYLGEIGSENVIWNRQS
jgi:hypothetical protein